MSDQLNVTVSLPAVWGICEYCGQLNVPSITFACCFKSMIKQLGPLNTTKVSSYYKGMYEKYFKRGSVWPQD